MKLYLKKDQLTNIKLLKVHTGQNEYRATIKLDSHNSAIFNKLFNQFIIEKTFSLYLIDNYNADVYTALIYHMFPAAGAFSLIIKKKDKKPTKDKKAGLTVIERQWQALEEVEQKTKDINRTEENKLMELMDAHYNIFGNRKERHLMLKADFDKLRLELMKDNRGFFIESTLKPRVDLGFFNGMTIHVY